MSMEEEEYCEVTQKNCERKQKLLRGYAVLVGRVVLKKMLAVTLRGLCRLQIQNMFEL